MRKPLIFTAICAPLALGGCAAIGGDGLLGDLLGGGDRYGYDARTNFERDAVQACGREAERFGRATVLEVEAQNREYMYVYGRIDSRDRNRDEFTCVFRNDGRIVDFQTR